MGASLTVGAIRRAVSAIAAPLGIAGGTMSLHAGGLLTDYSWNQPAGGVFEFPPNWEPFDFIPPGVFLGPPGPGEMATFALGNSTYTVTFGVDPTSLRLRVGDDHVTFNLSGHSYTLTSTDPTSLVVGGVGFVDDAMLTLTNGTIFGETAAIAAGDFGASAQLIVGSGALLDLDGALSIGKLDNGSLTIMSGGDVVCGPASIGDVVGMSGAGTGAVTVTGSGSTWDVNGMLIVGNNGNGSIAISENSYLQTNGNTFLGLMPGVTGALTIDGPLSVWDSFGDVFLGGPVTGPGGTASLTINPGAIVKLIGSPFFPNLYLRPGSALSLLGGTLTAAIQPEGGTFTWPTGVLFLRNAQAVVPGPLFASPLALDDSSTVLALFSLVVEGDGVVDVSNGAGLSGEGDLILNDGAIHVSSGGHASWTYAASIGELAGTTGAITLDGPGVSWTHSAPIAQEVNIGHGGSGAVSVVAAAALAIQGQCVPTLGRMDGSSGTLLVSGAGSQCSVEIHPLFVGSAGDGIVTIEEGATLSAPLIILGEIDGDGQLTIDGADSSVTASATTVGDFGTGALAVTNGAQLTGDCVIAQGRGSSAQAVIRGRGTQLVADGFNDSLIVGGAGSGTLDITDGATVEAGEVLIGDGSSGVGVLTLSGAGSALSADEEIDVGFAGAATLLVGSGTQVSAPLITVNPQSTIAGSGVLAGNVVSDGAIAPGLSAGVLSIEGACAFEGASVLAMELGGLAPGTQHDALAVTSDVELDGTLEVTLIDAFVPDPGDEFTIIETARGEITGRFARVVAPRGIDVIYTETAVILEMAGAACPADFDGDGEVDGADLATLLGGWGGSAADLDGDGTVGGPDLAIVLGAWGPC